MMPYIPARVHGRFRWNLAFSGGVLTDWGAHMIDLAQWGHDTEHTGPVEVEGKATSRRATPFQHGRPPSTLNYEYADGVTMTVRPDRRSIRFEGADGSITVQGLAGQGAAGQRAGDARRVIDPEKVKVYRPSEIVAARPASQGGEHRNFYDCMKTRSRCYARPRSATGLDHDRAISATSPCMLGRKLRGTRQREDFVGDAEASGDAYPRRAAHEPWTLANIDKWI